MVSLYSSVLLTPHHTYFLYFFSSRQEIVFILLGYITNFLSYAKTPRLSYSSADRHFASRYLQVHSVSLLVCVALADDGFFTLFPFVTAVALYCDFFAMNMNMPTRHRVPQTLCVTIPIGFNS